MITIQPSAPLPIEEVTRLSRENPDVDSFLAVLRANGFNQVDCIRALRETSSISLGKAKEIVHYSKTWADLRENSEALHEALYQAALADGWVDVSAESMVKTAT